MAKNDKDQDNGGSKKISPIAVEKALKGASYPADKDALVQLAQNNGAEDDVIAKIKSLPGDHFETTKDVMHALGQSE